VRAAVTLLNEVHMPGFSFRGRAAMAIKLLFALPFLLAIATTAFAQESPIRIADPKARPTAPGGTGVVYMTVFNRGAADDDLTGLSTPVADKAEMHRTATENGISRMEAVADLPVKANGSATFGPGGLHVMLTGLKQPLKLGDSFPLVLRFAKAGTVTVTVSVEQIKTVPKPMAHMPGMKM
jgi:copper(I)-binding protein